MFMRESIIIVYNDLSVNILSMTYIIYINNFLHFVNSVNDSVITNSNSKNILIAR